MTTLVAVFSDGSHKVVTLLPGQGILPPAFVQVLQPPGQLRPAVKLFVIQGREMRSYDKGPIFEMTRNPGPACIELGIYPERITAHADRQD